MLFCLGYGYVAQHLSPLLLAEGWQIGGSTRSAAKASAMQAAGIEVCAPNEIPPETTHLLVSVSPTQEGDPCIRHLPDLPNLAWVGYLSATSVYGDANGDWVDEETPAAPSEPRGKARVAAELKWLHYHPNTEIFRLSGIYGPGRSAVDRVKDGTAHCIKKDGHVMNRIHVADIAQGLLAAITSPQPQSITNFADNLPAPAHEVTAYTCLLMGQTPPPLVPFEEAELSEMARSFYLSNKRIRNDRLRARLASALASDLHYPSYKEGMRAILACSM